MKNKTISPDPKEFFNTAKTYLSNAHESMRRGEFSKACELCWGSAVALLKAHALLKNYEINHHAEIFKYANALAKDANCEFVYDGIIQLDDGHKNFYNLDKDEKFAARIIHIANRFFETMSNFLVKAGLDIKNI